MVLSVYLQCGHCGLCSVSHRCGEEKTTYEWYDDHTKNKVHINTWLQNFNTTAEIRKLTGSLYMVSTCSSCSQLKKNSNKHSRSCIYKTVKWMKLHVVNKYQLCLHVSVIYPLLLGRFWWKSAVLKLLCGGILVIRNSSNKCHIGTTELIRAWCLLLTLNSSEIPGELSRENMISSHVKITCYLHMWRYHRSYGYIINRAFCSKN